MHFGLVRWGAADIGEADVYLADVRTTFANSNKVVERLTMRVEVGISLGMGIVNSPRGRLYLLVFKNLSHIIFFL